MVLQKTIGFIGAGKMASALALGIVKGNVVAPSSIVMYDVVDAALKDMATHGFTIASSNEEVIKLSDIIIIAVKPQMFKAIVGALKSQNLNKKVVMSIMAGITMNDLENNLPPSAAVVRVAPNTPALVGKGASAFSVNKFVSDEDTKMVHQILSSVGLCVAVSESLIDAATAVAGCGPVYGYMMIEAMAEAGIKAGFSSDVAIQLAAQTLAGASEMVLATQKHPAVLKTDVCSPAGATIYAVTELEKQGLRNAVLSAVESSYQRLQDMKSLGSK